MQGGVTITFEVPALRAGDVAVALRNTDGGWVVQPSTVEAGHAKVTFNSL